MTRVLVDTHALLWWLTDDPALSATARATLADPVNDALVSVASLWEIAIKRSMGRLTAPDDLPRRITDEGFICLTIDPHHAWKVRELPPHHRDPVDRLLVAQALIERVPVITTDARFETYGVEIRW